MNDPFPEKLVIQICSDSEWKSTKSILKRKGHPLFRQPFGEWFSYPTCRQEWIFFQSGAGKTRAAAACQFAHDRWHPNGIINLGTCGGVAEEILKGDIILADRTVQYDCIIRFGKSRGFPYEEMVSKIDTCWVDTGQVSRRFVRGTIATGDQDLDGQTRKRLQEKSRLGRWNILGANWESGAIAKVAEWNRVRCLILRGVSDIPEPHAAGPDVQSADYEKNTPLIMEYLLEMMSQIRFHFLEAP